MPHTSRDEACSDTSYIACASAASLWSIQQDQGRSDNFGYGLHLGLQVPCAVRPI